MHHKQNIVKLNISRDEALNERIARVFRSGQIRLEGFVLRKISDVSAKS
jgi:hypothetical protein